MSNDQGTQVSDEMQKVLDHMTGLGSAPSALVESAMASGATCTWYGGCYYCKYHPQGPWFLVRCIA